MARVLFPLSLALLAACSGPKPLAVKEPVTLRDGCDVPEEGRVLRSHLQVERGAGDITIDGQATGRCGVFTLTPGPHRVEIHAGGPHGFGVGANLRAYEGGNTYDVFDFQCGYPGSCDTVTLRNWQRDVTANRAGMTDPCAALKLTNVRWESEPLDEYHPKSVDLTFELHVYSRPSGKPPHDPSCPEK